MAITHVRIDTIATLEDPDGNHVDILEPPADHLPAGRS